MLVSRPAKERETMTATVVILYVAKMNKSIHFQDFDKSIPGKIFPLPLLYMGNHVTGLGGTKKLSLPMFTVLRKFTILLTMIMESRILRKTFAPSLVCSVLAIVVGALVAASSDLSFNAEGYTFVLLNDVFTAASGVYTKKKLGMEGLGKYGVLFYNALIIIIPTVLVSAYTGDLQQNVAVMYIGMFIGGDYIFSWTNFLGLNICISAGLIYSYITFHSSGSSESKVQPAEDKLIVHITENHPEKT
ncbi:UDP-N-acetylglucosamine/UDP-glucose/GDP-mannose transporter [Labeo rohita]|uniref:UDP-N-acetylglucosamine/UDP-glucose/GDP-mannose transporter n=1 Tax=Labeo rohita TaxID=84645 RepID=A0ABQ8MGF7_LABRO|nr:UDP-N-acetylglucosamine/UDP-glucose/GDP-mannose transporter [Labeo rohita]